MCKFAGKFNESSVFAESLLGLFGQVSFSVFNSLNDRVCTKQLLESVISKITNFTLKILPQFIIERNN